MLKNEDKNIVKSSIFEKTMSACLENKRIAKVHPKKLSEKRMKMREDEELDPIDYNQEIPEDVENNEFDDMEMKDFIDDVVVVTDPELSVDEYEEMMDSTQSIVDATMDGEVPFTEEHVDDLTYTCPICGNTFFSEEEMSEGDECPVCGDFPNGYVLVGGVKDPEDVIEELNLGDDSVEEPVESEDVEKEEDEEEVVESIRRRLRKNPRNRARVESNRTNRQVRGIPSRNHSMSRSMESNGARPYQYSTRINKNRRPVKRYESKKHIERNVELESRQPINSRSNSKHRLESMNRNRRVNGRNLYVRKNRQKVQETKDRQLNHRGFEYKRLPNRRPNSYVRTSESTRVQRRPNSRVNENKRRVQPSLESMKSRQYKHSTNRRVNENKRLQYTRANRRPVQRYINSINESSFDASILKYLGNNYKSIKSYKTENVTYNEKGRSLTIEGNVKTSKNSGKIKFVIENINLRSVSPRVVKYNIKHNGSKNESRSNSKLTGSIYSRNGQLFCNSINKI